MKKIASLTIKSQMTNAQINALREAVRYELAATFPNSEEIARLCNEIACHRTLKRMYSRRIERELQREEGLKRIS